MEVWRIAKWSDTFETSDSRNYKSLPWVSVPTTLCSNGYQSLVEEFGADAPAIYGAWSAMVAVASKCPVRGTLATSKGVPYSLERIIREAYMHPDCLPIFQRLVAWASSETVGWLEDATKALPTPQASLGEAPTEPNLTDNQSERSIDRAMVFSGKEIGDDEWKELQPKLKAARKAIQPDERRKLKDADRELLIAAAAIERRAGVSLIDPILKSMKETKPQKPFPYFRTSFINACNSVGLDGRRALISIPMPAIQEAQPP
jgi:hypothetical protein